MSQIKSRTGSLTGPLFAVALAAVSLAGCNAMYSSSSAAHSMFAAGQVPEVYQVSGSVGVTKAAVDHSKEGVILSVVLDEVVLPQTWAKVGLDDKLFGVAVTKTDTAQFVTDGTSYFARYVKIGTSTTAKTLEASVSGSTVTYSGGGISLPDANLASDSQKFYYDALVASQYLPATDSTGTELAGASDNRPVYLRSTLDASWKTGRDAAVAFLLAPGRVLNGTATLVPDGSGATWKLGPDDTGIPSAWPFNQYWPLLIKAFEATSSSGTDGTSAATSE